MLQKLTDVEAAGPVPPSLTMFVRKKVIEFSAEGFLLILGVPLV